MNVQHAPTAMTESRERPSYARVPGRWLILGRVGWVVLVVLTLAIFFASLPVYLALLQTPCEGAACEYQQLTHAQVETLKGMGLTPGDYTAYTVALTLAIMVVCLAVSTLIVWRRSDDRMAFLVALMLVTLSPILEATAVPDSPSAWQVSSPRERQQTKWVVFGLAVPITVAVSVTVPYLIFPVFAEPGSLYPLAYNQVSILLGLCIPLSFGFAMLRSRLWEIDVLINRTLVYGALTASLAFVYFGLIFALQSLLRGLINQNNDVAIVVSILAIYALFHPLRRRIQNIIDRRFYRRKYDAAKIVATFSSTLRQEVDLDQLREQLLAVVQETMQPTHVSLWLRPPEPARKHQTAWSSPPPARERGEKS